MPTPLSDVIARGPLLVALSALVLGSCSGGSTLGGASGPPQLPARSTTRGSGSSPIAHVVVVIQENRSFDDFFSTFPGADGTAGGCMERSSRRVPRAAPQAHGCPGGDTYVPLQKVSLLETCDFGHSNAAFLNDYDGGEMDGFGLESGGQNCRGRVGTKAYQYVDPSQIAPYWDMAAQYVLADHMFQTQGSGSFTAHQDLIAGATIINRPIDTKSLVDFPTARPWGCDAPKGTKTSFLLWLVGRKRLQREYDRGPFPCLTYPTLRDLLDAKSVSWRYYSPSEPLGTGALWNAFDAIEAVRDGPEWTDGHIAKPKQFFSDVEYGTLPSMAWIVPDNHNSDHAVRGSDTGPSWVASIVNAIGESSYWDSTAIVIVWDDWGGYYDHVPPPFFDHWGGLGFRVPMIVVSAYAREAQPSQPGYVSHTQYEFGSILKFIENNWDLGTLGTTDLRATSIADCFDFTQSPRSFSAIPSKYGKRYFLRQPPSGEPVDTH